MSNNAQIERALAHLNAQKKPNITEAARIFGVAKSTLGDRFRGKSTSRTEFTSNTKKKLSTIQETVLVGYINLLSDRELSPTSRMVKNLTKDLVNSPIGVHWISRFCKRYQKQLYSIYLCTIDHKRKITNNSLYFEHYFNTISYLLKI